jgi:hypothetical protein
MRLRFSIRDLLWLTALVAVLVAWWVDHRQLSENRYTIKQSTSDSPTILKDNQTGENWVREGDHWVIGY